MANEEWNRRIWNRSRSIWGPPPPHPVRLCSVEGCERPYLARGWCTRHYHTQGREPRLIAEPRRLAPQAEAPGSQPAAVGRTAQTIAERAWALQADHERFNVRPARAKDHPSRQAWVAANNIWQMEVQARRGQKTMALSA
jgi:hypothetical protein